MRFLLYARANWHTLNGRSLASGVQLAALYLDDACDLIYWWMIEHATSDKREEIDAWLNAPDPDDPVADVADELAMFDQAAAMLTRR